MFSNTTTPTPTNDKIINQIERDLSCDVVDDSTISKIESLRIESLNENSRIRYLVDENDKIKHICNCSMIVNLSIIEGILIIGKIKLYFTADLYYDSSKKIILNMGLVPKELRDPINLQLSENIPDYESHELKTISDSIYSWYLNDIVELFRKPFLLRDVGLEVMFIDKSSYFFSFNNKNLRSSIYHLLNNRNIRNNNSNNYYGNQVKLSNLFSGNHLTITQLWESGKISNFYYLMVLNSLAGRSFNDITQYPIFPWVIADYTSEILDLNDPKSFRDLSKPMGAQGKERLNKIVERYEAMKHLNNDEIKPFHYGTHYSSAMIVSSYLMRLNPFTDSFLLLQGGKFGHADRLFNSIERTWSSAAIENITDVRELIPEFFYLPEFLLNINHYKLGEDQNGNVINDVILPPWANNDPKIFVRINRDALESKYVSEHLNEWIDLIFGYKQRGLDAINSFNVFNHLSYKGEINLDHIIDENEKRITTMIIHNFGQIPLQLFKRKHPRRIFRDDQNFSMSSSRFFKEKFILTATQQIISDRVCYIKGMMDVNDDYSWYGYPFFNVEFIEPTIGLVKIRLISKDTLSINNHIFRNLHKCQITVIKKWKSTKFLTGDSNGLIKLWEYKKKNNAIILNEISMLSGHLAMIMSIEPYLDSNILITLDKSGHVYSWDMKSYRIIRCFTNEGKFITVSPQSGNVAVITSDNILKIYTFNGLFYLGTKLHENVGDVITLNSLEYFTTIKHRYMKDMDYYIIGYSSDYISIHQLYLNKKSWEVRKIIPTLEVNAPFPTTYNSNYNSNNNNNPNNPAFTSKLSCLRAVLFISERQKKLQIILGYENGQVQTYTSRIQ